MKMKAPIAAFLLSLTSSAPVLAGTFVYVSNAEDGDIGMYSLQGDGSLLPGQRFKAAKLVMPMAVSPDKRFLIAAVRSKPFQAYSYSIDKSSGALNLVGAGALAESYPYISLDRTGRFLLGASYGGNQVGVNPVGTDGKVGEPIQVIPTARNAHSIRIDNTNHFVFVPHLGTDQVFQFVFDQKNGRLFTSHRTVTFSTPRSAHRARSQPFASMPRAESSLTSEVHRRRSSPVASISTRPAASSSCLASCRI